MEKFIGVKAPLSNNYSNSKVNIHIKNKVIEYLNSSFNSPLRVKAFQVAYPSDNTHKS